MSQHNSQTRYEKVTWINWSICHQCATGVSQNPFLCKTQHDTRYVLQRVTLYSTGSQNIPQRRRKEVRGRERRYIQNYYTLQRKKKWAYAVSCKMLQWRIVSFKITTNKIGLLSRSIILLRNSSSKPQCRLKCFIYHPNRIEIVSFGVDSSQLRNALHMDFLAIGQTINIYTALTLIKKATWPSEKGAFVRCLFVSAYWKKVSYWCFNLT